MLGFGTYHPKDWEAFEAYARDHRENLVTMVGNALAVVDSFRQARIPGEFMRDVILGAGNGFTFHGGDVVKGINLGKMAAKIEKAGAPHAAQFVRDIATFIENQRTGRDTPPATPRAIAAAGKK